MKMNTILTGIGAAMTAAGIFVLQMAGTSAAQMTHGSCLQNPSIQQPPGASQWPSPVAPIGTDTSAVKITNGPVVEHVTDTTAEIAWSTNVNAGTTLYFGTDPAHLDDVAKMPWGGLTHRVTLQGLLPNTTYYFRAESAQGQGTGTQAQTAPASFQTKPAGAASR